ncbi:MAG: hypothetical protein WCG25_03970 [bacterium]
MANVHIFNVENLFPVSIIQIFFNSAKSIFKIINALKYYCFAKIADCLITKYLLQSTSNSSGEYLVKYTMSQIFTSIGALDQLSKIFQFPTATTFHLLGFSLESGSIIQDFVLFSSSIASTIMWSSSGINFILYNI